MRAEILSIENTNCIKGIFAVCVLFHHLYQYTGIIYSHRIGIVLQALGYLSVGMFFFYTGYGMMLSKNKNGYVKALGKHRILPLYLFYVLLIILSVIWRKILGYQLIALDVVQSFFWGKTIVGLGWYLQVSFVIYFALWIVFSMPGDDKIYLMYTAALLTIYCVVCRVVSLPSTWYESVFCVLFGMIWASNKDTLDYFFKKRKWVAFFALLFLFSIAFIGTTIPSFIRVELKMLTAVIFSALIISAMYIIPQGVYNNTITGTLGKLSLEIYVCQGFFLLLRKDGIIYISNPIIFSGIVLIGTAVLSIIMKSVYEFIINTVKVITSDENN